MNENTLRSARLVEYCLISSLAKKGFYCLGGLSGAGDSLLPACPLGQLHFCGSIAERKPDLLADLLVLGIRLQHVAGFEFMVARRSAMKPATHATPESLAYTILTCGLCALRAA